MLVIEIFYYTFHFHINVLFQFGLLVQCFLGHMGGSWEANNDDAHIIQAALERETEDTKHLNNYSHLVLVSFLFFLHAVNKIRI